MAHDHTPRAHRHQNRATRFDPRLLLSPAGFSQLPDTDFGADSTTWTNNSPSPQMPRQQRRQRAALTKAVGEISEFYADGGVLDSQTTDTQYFGCLLAGSEDTHTAERASANHQPGPAEPLKPVLKCEDDASAEDPARISSMAHPLPPSLSHPGGTSRCSPHTSAPMSTTAVPASTTSAHLYLELQNTRRQLFEYCGRWALARTRIQELEDALAAASDVLAAASSDSCSAIRQSVENRTVLSSSRSIKKQRRE